MAVKEFKGCTPKELDEVMKEQKLLETLTHPNIVRLYESFELECSLYFVMEYVEFGTITSMIEGSEGKRLPEVLVRYFLKQILSGLAYLHSMKVIHRDIKVFSCFDFENVRMRYEGEM
jgi:serine/threonine protein kinase